MFEKCVCVTSVPCVCDKCDVCESHDHGKYSPLLALGSKHRRQGLQERWRSGESGRSCRRRGRHPRRKCRSHDIGCHGNPYLVAMVTPNWVPANQSPAAMHGYSVILLVNSRTSLFLALPHNPREMTKTTTLSVISYSRLHKIMSSSILFLFMFSVAYSHKIGWCKL